MYELEQKHIVNGLCKFANDVIIQKEKDYGDGLSSDAAEGKPQIFIDQLFKKRDVFTNDEINDEVNTIIITVLLEDKKESIESTYKLISLSGIRDSQQHFINDVSAYGVLSRCSRETLQRIARSFCNTR